MSALHSPAKSLHRCSRIFRPLSPVLIFLACVPGLLVVSGCTQPVTSTANPAAIAAGDYEKVFTAALLVLRDEGFIIDRHDYRFGRISAKPRRSPTLFEPWHSDNASSYQTLESTFNQQRRMVRVFLDPVTAAAQPAATQPSRCLVRVEVVMERQEFPGRRLTGSTDPGAMFSTPQTPAELRELGVNGAYWEPVGHDPYLEQYLAAAILRRAGTTGVE